jgi:hypothetical protein
MGRGLHSAASIDKESGAMAKASFSAAAALAGALLAGAAAQAASPFCTARFGDYDRAVLFFGSSGAQQEHPRVAPAIDRSIQRLRAGDCLTGWDEIAGLQLLGDDLRGTLRGEHGAPIRPTTLQVGVVLGVSSEVQARQFFAGLGYRVRSQGAPYLGRRIYVGPFTTEGGLAEARDVALRAGFVAPYPRRF